MDPSKLSKELISNPRTWRMSLEISEKALEMVTYSLSDIDTLIYNRIQLADTSSSPIAALGDAVYDNTLLLCDFSHTDVLIDTPRFIMAPADLSTEGMDSAIISAIWPNDNLSVIDSPVGGTSETLLSGVDTKLISFVRRTFPGCHISHRLTPLLSFLMTRYHKEGMPAMYVNIRYNRIDVMYIGDNRPEAVNTYVTPAVEDALYYILVVAKGCNMDINKEKIVICGNATDVSELKTFIGQYFKNVMIMDLPDEVTAMGSDAQNAPLELTLLPLCE